MGDHKGQNFDPSIKPKRFDQIEKFAFANLKFSRF